MRGPRNCTDDQRDALEEVGAGRLFANTITGTARHRPELDRLLELPEDGVRREGAALDRTVFEAVVAAAREHHPGI